MEARAVITHAPRRAPHDARTPPAAHHHHHHNTRASQAYFDSMPWLAVPFQDDTLRSVLSRKLQVRRGAVVFFSRWDMRGGGARGFLKAQKKKPRPCRQQACAPPPTHDTTRTHQHTQRHTQHPPHTTPHTAPLNTQVQGIPALTVLGPDSTVLCANARAAVAADPGGLRFPWAGMAVPK